MIEVKGLFQFSGSSHYCSVVACYFQNGELQVQRCGSSEVLLLASRAEYRFSEIIPGLAHEVLFHNGAVFTPEDASWRWPGSASQQLPARLETWKPLIALAVVLIPLLLWWLTRVGLPALASAMVPMIPVSLEQRIGEQVMHSLDLTLLDPSALPPEQQQQLRQDFERQLSKLQLSQHYQYQLHFRQSTAMGANAFALPGGQLTVTDELVQRLQDKPDALLAVLLHEVGHVEHRHGLQLTARATASTLVVALLFGDLDGVAELMLGTGSSLLQSAFSRDMERQADQFSTQALLSLDKSPEAFAEAMASFLPESGKKAELPWLLRYLQSHPDTLERIENAKALQPK